MGHVSVGEDRGKMRRKGEGIGMREGGILEYRGGA